MSALGDLETAVRTELSKSETRAAVEGLEHVVLEAVKNVLESAIPSWLRPLVGGLVDSFAEKGITTLEHLTDDLLKSLAPVQVQLGAVRLAIHVTKFSADLPQSQCETVADWPACKD